MIEHVEFLKCDACGNRTTRPRDGGIPPGWIGVTVQTTDACEVAHVCGNGGCVSRFLPNTRDVADAFPFLRGHTPEPPTAGDGAMLERVYASDVLRALRTLPKYPTAAEIAASFGRDHDDAVVRQLIRDLGAMGAIYVLNDPPGSPVRYAITPEP